MTFLDSQPAALAADGTLDPYAAFRIDRPAEIGALLRLLLDGSTPVQLCTPDGAHMNLALWTVDVAQRRLSFGVQADHPMTQRLVQADEVSALAYLDAVKLQFELDHLLLVRGAHAAALQCALPRRLYRFQRRGGFRVRATQRPTPQVRLRHPCMPDIVLKLRVLDMSIGGCALLLPGDVPPLPAGLSLTRVCVELDADTQFHCGLQIHHVSSFQATGGAVRVGCEFVKLDAQHGRALQRYIDHAQKRRRLLALD